MPSQPRKIRCCTLDIKFASVKEAGEALGITHYPIYAVLNDDANSVHGLYFIWLET